MPVLCEYKSWYNAHSYLLIMFITYNYIIVCPNPILFLKVSKDDKINIYLKHSGNNMLLFPMNCCVKHCQTTARCRKDDRRVPIYFADLHRHVSNRIQLCFLSARVLAPTSLLNIVSPLRVMYSASLYIIDFNRNRFSVRAISSAQDQVRSRTCEVSYQNGLFPVCLSISSLLVALGATL